MISFNADICKIDIILSPLVAVSESADDIQGIKIRKVWLGDAGLSHHRNHAETRHFLAMTMW